ncbi:MAG: TatD family hydrolase [Vampirovibrionales bacterium]|nr:TatD family hydrolase [Vampirovibrionales bacterium]
MIETSSFDFHCHVDLYPDPQKLIRECEDKKAFTLAVTTTPKAWRQNLEWAKNCKYVQVALGLHPELVGERFNELELLELYMAEANFIGEIGLDGSSRYKSSRESQQKVFCRILELSALTKKVLTVHSREASVDVINTLETYMVSDNILGILHWFTGSITDVKKALNIGCYFSINHKMLSSQKGRLIIQNLPLDRILTETDGPFTSTKNQMIFPYDTKTIPRFISEIKRTSEEEVLLAIRENAKKVISHVI